jgi:hypothetical protein
LTFTYATLDAGPFFESLPRMLQYDIRIVIRKDDSIHASRDGHEQSIVSELFDSALKQFSNLDIRDPEEFLLKNRSTHGQLKDAIKWVVASDPSTMRSTDLPCS